MKRALRQLMWFGVGGVIGFILDAGILQLLVLGLSWDRYSGRLISFLFAATGTWVFNRHFTFRGPRRHTLLGEWVRYVFAMSWGFACNYAAYWVLVYFFNFDGPRLIWAVAAGSGAGMGVNYMASRHWVFRHHKQANSSADGSPGN
jgi:putative flippase GtrA